MTAAYLTAISRSDQKLGQGSTQMLVQYDAQVGPRELGFNGTSVTAQTAGVYAISASMIIDDQPDDVVLTFQQAPSGSDEWADMPYRVHKTTSSNGVTTRGGAAISILVPLSKGQQIRTVLRADAQRPATLSRAYLSLHKICD